MSNRELTVSIDAGDVDEAREVIEGALSEAGILFVLEVD